MILIDSAGLRHTDCPIEAEGVRRAVAAAQQAHVVVQVVDAAAGGAAAGWARQRQQADEGDEGGAAAAAALPLSPQAVQLWVLNKADLLEGTAPGGVEGAPQQQAVQPAAEAAQAQGQEQPASPLLISCKSGRGVDKLLEALRQHVLALVSSGGNNEAAGALVTRARHR